ncbi:M20 family metallopeptidase [Thermovenabulum gondwanense]|uniref:Probable succinyl-diaminopimelate desuccinylase n=1 Tax=Thermovenabulum gondwanense TaxID=520767 RepID=A0A162M3L8_9FIRM|nr:M20 family metallopeptidase [Thermovenabulum gondwanense]KYO63792.1 putative succinyl-diaminopimelate desuccinylase [Thermovenabulum gondwanense]
MSNVIEKVIGLIKEEELVSLTQELIRIPSVYDPLDENANEERVAKHLYEKLKQMGFETYIEEVAPKRPNVIAVLKGDMPGKTVLLEGHTDVVMPGDESKWKYNPFGGEVFDGKIYGRGACDTKGNLAASIIAAKAIKDSGISFPGKIILCIPVDEEGMMTGIKDFIRRGWADDVNGAIICEPVDNNICLDIKGAMRILVKVKGKMAHGCMPYAGINPNIGMAKVILKLKELEKKEKERLGCHQYLGYPSITPTVVMSPSNGKGQLNVVPEDSLIAYDLRTVPGQVEEVLIGQIEEIFNKLKKEVENFDCEYEVIEKRPCVSTERNNPIVKAVEKAYTKVTGREPFYNGVPGATDGTFLRAWKGIPVVVIGAGEREIPHQRDEYVSIEQLVETTKIYAASILNFLYEKF